MTVIYLNKKQAKQDKDIRNIYKNNLINFILKKEIVIKKIMNKRRRNL
jgi:hypothetical protein